MHRAVLLATGDEIGADAILTPEGEALGPPRADPAARAAADRGGVTARARRPHGRATWSGT